MRFGEGQDGARSEDIQVIATDQEAFESLSPLPPGIRSRFLEQDNGLRMHILEAGYEDPERPMLLLLHGFPELAYSWRKVMTPLAEAGYHVVAPDQRGYGRTSGWDPDYDGDLTSFRMPNLVRDLLALLASLNRRSVAAVIGHDFGSFVAAWCALIRPDVFRSVALLSAPFGGPPAFAPGADGTSPDAPDIHSALAALPRPRKHYQWYYGNREANADMMHCRQGLADFLRAYFHVKSADWPDNDPKPLRAWSADELARMPTYYIMDLDQGMAETVAPHMPTAAEINACTWLSEADLKVYAEEFGRSGFQGGLQWYRCTTGPEHTSELRLFGGRTIDVPSCYIAGAKDWGIYQKPGAFEAMQNQHCSDMRACDLLPGAGHWVQQEQPEAVVDRLRDFLGKLG